MENINTECLVGQTNKSNYQLLVYTSCYLLVYQVYKTRKQMSRFLKPWNGVPLIYFVIFTTCTCIIHDLYRIK